MRKTFIIAIAALLALGAGGYFGFNYYVQYEARRQVDELFASLNASGITARHGKMTFEYFDSEFDIKDVVFEAPGQGTLKIGSFVAKTLSIPHPRQMFADRIEIRDVAFDGPLPLAPDIAASYRIPLIGVDKFQGPTEIVTSGNRPAQLALALFEAVSADRISIPTSTGTTKAGAGATLVETSLTAGATTIEWLVRGEIKKATIEPSHVKVTGSPNVAGNGDLGRVVAEAVNLPTLLILLDPERRRSEQVVRNVYGSVVIDGYNVASDAGFSQRWKTIAIKDVAITPAGVPVEELVAMGERMQALTAKGETAPEQEVAALLRATASTYDALRIGSVTLTEMETRQDGGAKASLRALAIGKLDAGLLKDVTLEGFSGTDGTTKPFDIERMVISGLRPGAMMRLTADTVAEPDNAASFDHFMRSFSVLSGFEMLGAKGALDNSAELVVIDKLNLSWDAKEGAIPTRLAASLRVTGPTNLFAEGDPMGMVVPDGVSRASLALDIGANWNPQAQTFALAPLYVEVSDAFSVSASLSLKDVSPSAFSAQPDEALAAAMAANFASAELTLIDYGIYEQKLRDAAKEQGMEPEAIRQLFAGFAEMLLGSVVSDRPEFDPAVQALIAFIQRPMGRLALRVTPRGDNLPVLMLLEGLQGDPMELISEVNIEVIKTP